MRVKGTLVSDFGEDVVVTMTLETHYRNSEAADWEVIYSQYKIINT